MQTRLNFIAIVLVCPFSLLYDTIRYDTRCSFNVQSKADMSQLNLPHGTNNQKVEQKEKRKTKPRICSEVSVNSPGNPWSQSLRKGRLR